MKTVTFDETKWQLVPIEPTNEMLHAINWPSSYKTLLEVAPQPEQGEVKPVGFLDSRTMQKTTPCDTPEEFLVPFYLSPPPDYHTAKLHALVELIFALTLPYNNGEPTFSDKVTTEWRDLTAAHRPPDNNAARIAELEAELGSKKAYSLRIYEKSIKAEQRIAELESALDVAAYTLSQLTRFSGASNALATIEEARKK